MYNSGRRINNYFLNEDLSSLRIPMCLTGVYFAILLMENYPNFYITKGIYSIILLRFFQIQKLDYYVYLIYNFFIFKIVY